MGTNLLDLPDEVLVLILADLHTSKRMPGDHIENGIERGCYARLQRQTLCNLAQSNRRLHNLAYPILLEDVRLTMLRKRTVPGVTGPHTTHDRSRTTGPEATQALGKPPVLLDELMTFEICWNSRTPDTWMKDLFETVASAKNLAVLNIEGFNDRIYSKSDCAFVEDRIDGLKSLSDLMLAIDGFDMTASLFSKICSLPQLDYFVTSARVYGPKPLRETIASPLYGLEEGRKSEDHETEVTDLTCSGDYLDLETLRRTLDRSPKLQELQITLPGPGVVSDFGMKQVGGKFASHIDATYRPCLVTKALLPSISTLKSLHCKNHKVSIPFHDGSVLDLSSFQRLRELEISVRLLARTELQGRPQNDLSSLPGLDWYKNLPSCLKILLIYFDYSKGLLWNVPDLETLEGYDETGQNCDSILVKRHVEVKYCKRMNSDFGRRYFEPRVAREITSGSRLRWVKELIDKRFEHLSGLAWFRILETDKVGHRQRRAWGQLDLAAWYPETFGRPEIDLGIVVRTPQGYTAPPFNRH